MTITYWFLPGIILLGIVTTYTDLKEGKIKNKHILLALAYSFLAYTTIVLMNWETIRLAYFTELFILCSMALTTGFLLWYVGLWTAGDAKLLVAYSALIPLSVYKYGHLPYFDYTNILINTLIPMFIFLLTTVLLRTNLRQKIFFIKKAFRVREILSVAMFLFALGWLVKLFFGLLKISSDYFITMFALFLIMILLERITSISMLKIMITIGILRLILDRSVFSYSFSVEFFFFLFSFVILRFFILHLGFYIFTQEVDIKLLRPGMLPAEIIYKDKEGYKKQEVIFYSLLGYIEEKTRKREYLIEPTSEGLTEEDVKKLYGLEKKLGFEHLRVQQTIPFAPYMLLGVLLTLIAQGNSVIRLLTLL